MRKRTLITLLLFFLFVWTSVAFAGLNIQEGEWEITTVTEIPGMPFRMPEVKHTQCLTKKSMIPTNPEKGQDCEILDVDIRGNTVSWTVKCMERDGTMEGRGEITYKGNTFAGVSRMTMDNPMQGRVQITTKMSGRRLGDCK